MARGREATRELGRFSGALDSEFPAGDFFLEFAQKLAPTHPLIGHAITGGSATQFKKIHATQHDTCEFLKSHNLNLLGLTGMATLKQIRERFSSLEISRDNMAAEYPHTER